MSEIIVGRRFRDDIDVAEVARLVRADLTALRAVGMLPSWKIGVRSSRFSMGAAVDATVAAPSDQFVQVADWDGTLNWKMSGSLVIVVREVETLINDFNRHIRPLDGYSRTQSRFYVSVTATGCPPPNTLGAS